MRGRNDPPDPRHDPYQYDDPLGVPHPDTDRIAADALSRLWDQFVDWWTGAESYDPQVGDSFPEPGDAGGELPPGGLDGWDDGTEDGSDGGTGCFTGDTPVLMADGLTKAIGQITIGDQVMARGENTGVMGSGTVVRTFRHLVKETLLLQLDGGEVVETTAAHRFAAFPGNFVSAGELRPGDSLSTHTRTEGGAKIISIAARSAPATVYNLSVEQFQTYFVGKAELWVHNLKIFVPVEEP